MILVIKKAIPFILMKMTIPIVIEHNDARNQWDVLWGIGEPSHMQEIDENAKNPMHLFRCPTVLSMIKKFNLSKERQTKAELTLVINNKGEQHE